MANPVRLWGVFKKNVANFEKQMFNLKKMLQELNILKQQQNKGQWHVKANKMVQLAFGEQTKKWAISFKQVMQIIKDQTC